MTRKSSFLEFLYSSTDSTISKYMILDNDRVQTGKYLNGYSVLFFLQKQVMPRQGNSQHRALRVPNFQQMVSMIIIFINSKQIIIPELPTTLFCGENQIRNRCEDVLLNRRLGKRTRNYFYCQVFVLFCICSKLKFHMNKQVTFNFLFYFRKYCCL